MGRPLEIGAQHHGGLGALYPLEHEQPVEKAVEILVLATRTLAM